MYKDVDAVTDYPAFYFWEEIHKAFPEAKVILMLREDEDAWCNSMEKQLRIMEGSFLLRLMQYLSPTARNTAAKVFPYLGSVVLGHTDSFHWKPFRWARINRELLKLKFRAHNAHVVQNVRPEKFLQFKCSDGWEPLCKFLDVAIPDETFPHENKSGEILQKLLETNPHLMKMKREVLMSSAIITLTTGIAGYFLFTRGPRNIYHSVTSWMKTLPEILHTRT
uniref:uncharacterized protein LOC120347234 n=1 Tax=Styela clava TaxID=7725 RepID=UPI001939451B|nr:uncharacterized protein LOC120347234 [Styela clava]